MIKREVPPMKVVEPFDVIEDGEPRLFWRPERGEVDQLTFQGGEEALGQRVVLGVADRPRRERDPVLSAAEPECEV